MRVDKCMIEVFKGLSGFRCTVDDFMIYGNITYTLTVYSNSCKDVHTKTLHSMYIEKCQFFKTQVTFAGFRLSSSGHQIDLSITEAIITTPHPLPGQTYILLWALSPNCQQALIH